MTTPHALHPAPSVAAFGEGIWAKMKPAGFILAKIPMVEADARHSDHRLIEKSLPCA